MFIHFGLYSIPAGEWTQGPHAGKGHAEWIRDTAQIPVAEYEKLKGQFNPTKFNADAWAAAAKNAGMQYLCITTKHHDGFCLFDTKQTDWSVMHTPFQRDIMREVADACRREGITPCWYHSIMDWHNYDYLPRRPWERGTGDPARDAADPLFRPTKGADFVRYNQYLDNQVTELLTNYGPIGIMWFDGQWEGTWNHARGQALYNLCRKLQPSVIVNNRCDRGGNLGSINATPEPGVKPAGDYLTPEQMIPELALPGEWETCMTMNDHWGYNKFDRNYKSTEDLIHDLVETASVGGNFLLNVGPMPDGEFPPESIQRLNEIGKWMAVNGESIHGTLKSPFEKEFDWGFCTQKAVNSGIISPNHGGQTTTRLYLHVVTWPKDGILYVPLIFNQPRQAALLAQPSIPLKVMAVGPHTQKPDQNRPASIVDSHSSDDGITIELPSGLAAPDPIDTVIVLDIVGEPDIARTPRIVSSHNVDSEFFVSTGQADAASYTLETSQRNVELRYTLDGTDPTATSPVIPQDVLAKRAAASGTTRREDIRITESTIVTAQAFRNGHPASPIIRRNFIKVTPLPAVPTPAATKGVTYQYFEGDWNALPNFTAMRPQGTGIAHAFDGRPRPAERIDRFGFRYHGYYTAPETGVYAFHLASDDGSNLYVDGQKIINNDGLHSLEEKTGSIALAKGPHALIIDFFEKSGGYQLDLAITTPTTPRKPLNPDDLTTEAEAAK
jgi:alpha-L-fucosidase